MTELTMPQQQDAAALVAKQMTQDIAEAHEAMGMIKAFGFMEKLLTVSNLKVLNEIKETKKYKGLSYIGVDGLLLTVSTWEDFCKACNLSHKHVDENLRNLSSLGEDFLETSQRLGLGYREMRKLRQLPEEARAEIVEADYSDTTDKEELLEKIEDLTARHAKEKAALETRLKTTQANYEAQTKILQNKDDRLNRLDKELIKKNQLIETMTPDQKGGLLREEAAAISYSAEAILRGQVWKAFEALTEHSAQTQIDHRQFMCGVLAEYQLIISELKQQFGIDDHPTGDDLPEWARPDYTPDVELDENLARILDDVSEAELVE